MTDVNEMSRIEMVKTLTRFAHRDEEELLDMDNDELTEVMSTFIDDFYESDLKEEIEKSTLIDLDDEELSIYDILSEWEDINDDSDLYPNGPDDE